MFVEEKTQGEVTESPTKTLKLSEAIRIGAAIRQQVRGAYFFKERSCVLGAAWEGFGNHLDEKTSLIADWVTDTFGIPERLVKNAVHRNDFGESREQIADWLEAQGY